MKDTLARHCSCIQSNMCMHTMHSHLHVAFLNPSPVASRTPRMGRHHAGLRRAPELETSSVGGPSYSMHGYLRWTQLVSQQLM